MRNDFEIESLNPQAAEIGQAKHASRPGIGNYVLGKPTHHVLRVGQKRKDDRLVRISPLIAASS
jgi:hypothetical protein